MKKTEYNNVWEVACDHHNEPLAWECRLYIEKMTLKGREIEMVYVDTKHIVFEKDVIDDAILYHNGSIETKTKANTSCIVKPKEGKNLILKCSLK